MNRFDQINQLSQQSSAAAPFTVCTRIGKNYVHLLELIMQQFGLLQAGANCLLMKPISPVIKKRFFCARILTHVQYKDWNPYSCPLFYPLVNWTCFSVEFAPWTHVGRFCVGVYKPSAAPCCTSVGVSMRLKCILRRILLGGGFTTTRVCVSVCVCAMANRCVDTDM